VDDVYEFVITVWIDLCVGICCWLDYEDIFFYNGLGCIIEGSLGFWMKRLSDAVLA
jgi:hypothetical protein